MMIIKEVYMPVYDESGNKDWVEITVINLFKAMHSRHIDGITYNSEQMTVVGYYKPTGEIIESILNETIIKTIYDEKSGKSTTFSAPAGTGATGKKDRKYLYPDNHPA